MKRSKMWHVGVIVPNLEEAQARLSSALGLEFGPISETTIEICDSEGRYREVTHRICFTLEPPYMELITEIPGTPWVCNEYSNLHHISFYTDDVPSGSQSLSTAGCPFEQADRWQVETPDLGFAYHRDAALGLRIEYVGQGSRPWVEDFLLQPPAS